MAATELRKLGWPGKGSFEFEPPRDGLAPTYTVSGSFELEARPEFIEGKAFAPPQRLPMLVRPGEFLLGSWTVRWDSPPKSGSHRLRAGGSRIQTLGHGLC